MAVLARRLILGRGGGSIIAPAYATVELAAAPVGGGVISPDPKAYYYNGRTFFTYVRGSTGATGAAYYDHATRLPSDPNDISDLGSPDTHDLPALMVRESDKRILTAFSRHGGSSMLIRVSLNPEDTLGAWPAATNIDSQLGGTAYYAPSLAQLRGVTNDPIWLLYHNRVSSIESVCFSHSTDDGVTWAAQTVLFSGGEFFVGYHVGTDWDTRIAVITIDGDPYTQPTSVYYMELDGITGTWQDADGTPLTLPLGPGDLTPIHDGATGAAFPTGVMFDSSGNPAMTYLVNIGATNSARRAQWNGTSWDVEEVAEVGVHPADRFSTGLTISDSDPDVVFLGDLVSGRVENFRYRRIAGVWTPQQITFSSPDDNAQISAVILANPGLQATWFQGSLVTSSDFNMKTMGWGSV